MPADLSSITPANGRGADEFGQWRPVCNRFGAQYLGAYHAYVQKSSPEEEVDGRVDLYKLKKNNSKKYALL